jgi:hypothetical protein
MTIAARQVFWQEPAGKLLAAGPCSNEARFVADDRASAADDLLFAVSGTGV